MDSIANTKYLCTGGNQILKLNVAQIERLFLFLSPIDLFSTDKNQPQNSLFSIYCTKCGGMCCYADDSTFSISDKDPTNLSKKLSEKYNTVAEFLTANKLKVNDDKTHLLVMTTRQQRNYINTSSVTVTTQVTPSTVERLLWAQVHENMRWKEHMMIH